MDALLFIEKLLNAGATEHGYVFKSDELNRYKFYNNGIIKDLVFYDDEDLTIQTMAGFARSLGLFDLSESLTQSEGLN